MPAHEVGLTTFARRSLSTASGQAEATDQRLDF